MTPTADPRRARDVSRPTSPFTPLFARIPNANITSCESRSDLFMRGIAGTRDVPVAWTPIFCAAYGKTVDESWPLLRGRHRLFRRPDRARRYFRGGLPDAIAVSDVGRSEGKEEVVSSAPTSADPIPEADAPKANEVHPAETKTRDDQGEADVFKEATVTQVAFLTR